MLDLVDIGKGPFSAYRGIAPDEQLDEVRPRRRAPARRPHPPPQRHPLRRRRLGDPALRRPPAQGPRPGGRVEDHPRRRCLLPNHQAPPQRAPGRPRRALRRRRRPPTSANCPAQRPHLATDYDFIIVHDPQPAALPMLAGPPAARGGSGAATSTPRTPNPEVWEFLTPFLAPTTPPSSPCPTSSPRAFPSAASPFTRPPSIRSAPRTSPSPESSRGTVLEWIGVRLDRPLVTQVSRFDPWKDPLGVIAAYRRVRHHVPDLQLALVGSLALR